MASFVDRMVGAARLDVNTFEEVEADTGAMGQAMAVVVLSSLAAGIGALGLGGLTDFIRGVLLALIGWFVWAFLTYVIGTKVLSEPQTSADIGQLLRTIGFSAAPGILRVLGVIPILGGVIAFVAGIWMLAAMIVAVRQALDYRSTLRAAGVCLIGWLVYVVLIALPTAILGYGAC